MFATPSASEYQKLIISELYYNPPGTNGIDGEAFEFIEFLNTGTTTLDLGGISTEGIVFVFQYPTLLPPGGYFVLARDSVRFAERFPDVAVGGIYSGKLDNKGETVTLLDPAGAVISRSHYNNEAPWPTAADGTGASLQRVDTSPENSSFAAHWTAAPPTPGASTPAELIDSDVDGMPDYWELKYGFNIHERTDAGADPDGDGLSNRGEFFAGTNPFDRTESLRFTSIREVKAPAAHYTVLTFQAMANKSYTLFYQNGLDDDCWTRIRMVEARSTNWTATFNQPIYPFPIFYHLGCPAEFQAPCEELD